MVKLWQSPGTYGSWSGSITTHSRKDLKYLPAFLPGGAMIPFFVKLRGSRTNLGYTETFFLNNIKSISYFSTDWKRITWNRAKRRRNSPGCQGGSHHRKHMKISKFLMLIFHEHFPKKQGNSNPFDLKIKHYRSCQTGIITASQE